MNKTLTLNALLILSSAFAQPTAPAPAPAPATNTAATNAAPSMNANATVVTDIPADQWARSAVALVLQKGLMNAYDDNTFRGTQPLTRYEAASLLSQLLQSGDLLKAVTGFSPEEKETINTALISLADQIVTISVRQQGDVQDISNLADRLGKLEGVVEQIVAVGASRQDVETATEKLRLQITAQLADYASKTDVEALTARLAVLEAEKAARDAAAAEAAAQAEAKIPKPGDLPDVKFRPDARAKFALGIGVEKRMNVDKIGYTISGVARNVVGPLDLQFMGSYGAPDMLSAQLNLTKSFSTDSQITPYVGLGAGIMYANDSTKPEEKSASQFASVIAGADYNFTDTMILYFEGDARYYFNNRTAATGISPDAAKGLNGNIRAGVRINF